MNKLFFKYGLYSGLGLSIIVGLSFYLLFLKTPTIELSKINFTDINGNLIDQKMLLEKPLVINYWATWCKPCIEEMPAFETLSNKYKGQITFLFVTDEEQSEIINFSKRKKFNLFFAKSSENLSKIGINVRPTTYFYKKSGSLMVTVVGGLKKQELEKILKELSLK
jgi:thiol-disulfide isomerase/thioredoxin